MAGFRSFETRSSFLTQLLWGYDSLDREIRALAAARGSYQHLRNIRSLHSEHACNTKLAANGIDSGTNVVTN